MFHQIASCWGNDRNTMVKLMYKNCEHKFYSVASSITHCVMQVHCTNNDVRLQRFYHNYNDMYIIIYVPS